MQHGLIATILVVMSGFMALEAQNAVPDGDPVILKGEKIDGDVRLIPGRMMPGGEATLEFRLAIDLHWHIYPAKKFPGEITQPTEIELKSGVFTRVGDIEEPTSLFHDGGDEHSRYHYFETAVVMRAKVKLAADAKPPLAEIEGTFNYLPCDANGCLPPQSIRFRIPVAIGPAGAVENGGAGAPASVDLTRIELALARMNARLDTIEEHVVPTEVPAPPAGPDWSPVNPVVKIIGDVIRAGETTQIAIRFKTPEEAHLKAFKDVFVDFSGSVRVDTIDVVSATSTADGLEHEIVAEVVAKGNAESGEDRLLLDVTMPLAIAGFEHGFEVQDLELKLAFGTRSVAKAIWTAVIAALFALLTPCVFPMVPVTVSFFTKQAENRKQSPMLMPLVYVAGIIVSFVFIGVIVTSIARAAGAGAAGAQILATNGWLQGAFGALFVLFALALFGVFNLQPPAWLMERAGSVQGKGGLVGTLGMGLLFSLTSFTCTAPLVGTLLVDALTTGEWFFPVIGMLVFSSVLALPFFFLALFPGLLAGLPKSGSWMNNVKVTLGFIEMAFALKFIGAMDVYFGWALFTRTAILWLWAVLFILNALYLLGLMRFAHDGKSERAGGIAGTVAVVLILLALLMLEGTRGRQMPYLFETLLPPPLVVVSEGGDFGWANRLEDDLEGAQSLARKLGAPLFIDFTGYT